MRGGEVRGMKRKEETYEWCAYWYGTSIVPRLHDGSVDPFDRIWEPVEIAC